MSQNSVVETADLAPDSPTPKRARPVKTRSEGQWALGEREPLTHNEVFKREDDALNVRKRIEEIYSKQGFASIDPDDLRGRFRWMGLYTQRNQGLDGTFTGDDNNDILEAPYFMLRVRTDGKPLSLEQLRVVAGISKDFARNSLDLSNRQNFQFHWIEIESMPEIWRRLEAVDLQTTEACGDCPRGILGSPLAGLAADEIIDASPAIDEIVRRHVGNPEYSNLPRKFKTAISGLQDLPHEINDISFVGVNHPEHGPGLDLWVGGGLSTVPMFAQRLGVWVPLDEVVEVWEGVAGIFRDYGYRRLRSKARLKFLVKDWGPEKVREILETEYLGRKLLDGPAPEPLTRVRDHVGVQRLTTGLNAVGASPVSGRISGTMLESFIGAVERSGATEVRTTPYQKLIVINVEDDKVAALTAELDAMELPVNPTPWRRSLMSCTGLEYCKLAFTETRSRSVTLLPELEARLEEFNAELDVPITIHLNGCPNSCARIQIADMGFKGQLITLDDGQVVEGFQVHLGGSLGADESLGRKLRGHKVLSSELGDYIDRLVRNFMAAREPAERFAQWVVRAEEEQLR